MFVVLLFAAFEGCLVLGFYGGFTVWGWLDGFDFDWCKFVYLICYLGRDAW